MRPSRSPLLVVLVALVALVAACGDSSSPETAAPTDESTETTGEQGDDAGSDSTSSEDPPGDDVSFDLSGSSVRLGITQASALQAPAYYAADLLAEWGLDVQTEVLSSTNGVEAIVADQIDFAARSQDEALRGVDAGAELVAVGSYITALPYVIVAKEDITDIASLEGRTLAVASPASYDTLMFRYLLGEEGLDPDADVSFTTAGGPPDRAAAMLSGQVDAAMLFLDGWISIRDQADDLHVLTYLSEVVPEPGLHMGFWFGSQPYVEENPDVALALACANLEANAWAQGNKDAFVEYTLSIAEGTEEGPVSEAYDEAMQLNMWPTNPEELLSAEQVDHLVEILNEEEILTGELDTSEIVQTRFLTEAADMGCGA